MKQRFVTAKSKKEAQQECSWAEKIVKVFGGYMCFESFQDFITWKRQK